MTWNPYLFPQKPSSRRNKTHILTARVFLKPRLSNFRRVAPRGAKMSASGTENLIKCPGLPGENGHWWNWLMHKTDTSLRRTLVVVPFFVPFFSHFAVARLSIRRPPGTLKPATDNCKHRCWMWQEISISGSKILITWQNTSRRVSQCLESTFQYYFCWSF